MNTQREVIYEQRRQVLDGEDLQAVHPEHAAQHPSRTPSAATWASRSTWTAEELPGGCALLPRPCSCCRTSCSSPTRSCSSHDAGGAGRPAHASRRRGGLCRRKEQEFTAAPDAGAGAGHHAAGGGRVLDGPDRRHERPASRASACGPTARPTRWWPTSSEGYEMFEEMIAAIQEETLRRLFLVRIAQGADAARSSGSGWPRSPAKCRRRRRHRSRSSR